MLSLVNLRVALATGRPEFWFRDWVAIVSSNNERLWNVVGTLSADSRCMADKERRGASRARHEEKDRYHG
jgi:hypothetical protein